MSLIFTIHDPRPCERCREDMMEMQPGRFKCLSCGAKEDNY